MSSVNPPDHDVVVDPNTFVPFCRTCNDKFIDCDYLLTKKKSFGVKTRQMEESPEEAYDRAMKGVI